jgi:hypothetical protein
MERAKGIEPSYEAWEASVLPLNYARKRHVSNCPALYRASGAASIAIFSRREAPSGNAALGRHFPTAGALLSGSEFVRSLPWHRLDGNVLDAHPLDATCLMHTGLMAMCLMCFPSKTNSSAARGARNMGGKLLVAVISLSALASPAWSFGFTAGAQIEERMGSEYGSEYYYRNAERCRVVVMKDRKGRRVKVRRCR